MNKFTPFFFVNTDSVEVEARAPEVPVVTTELDVSAASTNWDVCTGVHLFINEFSDSSVSLHALMSDVL